MSDQPTNRQQRILNVDASQAALRESQDRYRDLVENSRDLICTHDLQGKLLWLNPAVERATGYTRKALLGMNLADLIVAEARAGFPAYLAEIQTSGTARGLMRIQTASGDKRWWEYDNTLRTEGVATPVVRGMAQDVTERRKLEQALMQSEQRFRSLIEQSLAGVYITLTKKGVLQYANPRLEQMLGYGPGEMIGLRIQDMILAEDLPIVLAQPQKLRNGAASSSYEVRVWRKDGSVIEMGVQGSFYESGGESATIGMAQDITEKKRAEAEIGRYVTELETAFMSTVEVAMRLSELRDPYTAGHERRVGEIAVAIGAELGFDARQQEGLRVAGYLHDIGKITIPTEILSKPGRLTAIEFKLIQGHSQASYDVLKDVRFPWPVAQIALQHHERMDGSGYPQGLTGEAILLEARIMAVADVVEAMSSHRPYRAGLGLDKALAEIERGRASVYDPQVADACLRLFREKGYSI